MEDEEDDSFYKPIPNSLPFKSKKDDDADSDDSFDKFEPSQSTFGKITKSTEQIGTELSQAKNNGCQLMSTEGERKIMTLGLHLKEKPSCTNTSSNAQNLATLTRNSSISRRGSDQSFFRSFSQNSRHTQKTTPPTKRPATPNGEMLMLRSQLENERKEKAKMVADYQKTVKDLTEKFHEQLKAKEEEKKKLIKENETLKINSACRKFSTPNASPSYTSPHHVEIKKICPKIPSVTGSIHKRSKACNEFNTPCTSKTPRRNVEFVKNPLTAFRHEGKLKLSSNTEDEDTFQIEDSFEPSATSTPRAVPVFRNMNGMRRGLQLDNEDVDGDVVRGAPCSKKMAPSIVDLTREEVKKKVENIWERFEDDLLDQPSCSKSTENFNGIEEDSQWIDEFLSNNLRGVSLSRKREKIGKMTKSKMKDIANRMNYVDECRRKCEICNFDEPVRIGSDIGKKREWEIADAQRMERERKEAEAHLALTYSTIAQTMNRNGISKQAETVKLIKSQAERKYREKLGKIEERSRESMKEEKRKNWKEKYMAELKENGEILAKLEADIEARTEREDYIWTSSDDEVESSSPWIVDQTRLCATCSARNRIDRRIQRREMEKMNLKVQCLEQYGKEKREELRNASILTKSKIDAADRELGEQINELYGSRFMEEENFVDSF